MAFGQHHRGVEADDRKLPRNMQNGLDDVLSALMFGVVELRGLRPREGCSIVPVIHVARSSVAVMAETEDYSRVGLVVVMIFNLYLDAAIGGKVGTFKTVSGEGTLPTIDEPVGMFDDPLGVDAHVVGHHVTCQPD